MGKRVSSTRLWIFCGKYNKNKKIYKWGFRYWWHSAGYLVKSYSALRHTSGIRMLCLIHCISLHCIRKYYPAKTMHRAETKPLFLIVFYRMSSLYKHVALFTLMCLAQWVCKCGQAVCNQQTMEVNNYN